MGTEMFTGHSPYREGVMQVRLTATRLQTLIVTLASVLQSGNAKSRVSLV